MTAPEQRLVELTGYGSRTPPVSPSHTHLPKHRSSASPGRLSPSDESCVKLVICETRDPESSLGVTCFDTSGTDRAFTHSPTNHLDPRSPDERHATRSPQAEQDPPDDHPTRARTPPRTRLPAARDSGG